MAMNRSRSRREDPFVAAEERRMIRNEDAKQDLLDDPIRLDQAVAGLSRSAMTDKVAAKMPANANLDRALLAIDENDPRRKMLMDLRKDMPSIIKNSGYGSDPGTAVMKEYKRRSDLARPDAYKFIQKNEGWFGKNVAPEEGYDEWVTKNPTYSNPITNAIAWGAVPELLGQVARSGAGKLAMTGSKLAKPVGMLGSLLSMTPPVGPGGVALKGTGIGLRVAAAGLAAAGAMAVVDSVKIAAAEEGQPLGFGAEMALSLPVWLAGAKLAGVGVKAFDKRAAGKALLAQRAAVADAIAMPKYTKETLEAIDGKTKKDAIDAFKTLNLKELENKRIARLSALNDDDRLAVLAGADIKDVTKKRLAVNMAEEAKQLAKNKADEAAEIMSRAKEMVANVPGMDIDSAAELARRTVRPSILETAADTEVLRKGMGLPEEMLSLMSPRQKAIQAAAYNKATITKPAGMAENLQTRIKETLIPPPVASSKVITKTPMEEASGLQSMLRNNLISEKQIAVAGERNSETIIRATARAVRHAELSTLKGINKEARKFLDETDAFLKGSTGTTKAGATIAVKPLTSAQRFEAAKTDIGNVLKETGEEIVANTANKPQSIRALAILSGKVDDSVEQIITSNRMNSLQAQELRATATKQKTALLEKFKQTELDSVEAAAKEEMMSDLAALGGTGSPKGMAMTEANQQALIKQKAKEWRDMFGTKKTITPDEFKAKEKDVVAWMEKWKKGAALGIPAVTGMIALNTLFASEADAAAFGNTVKQVPAVIGSMVKNGEAAGMSTEAAVKAIVDAGYRPPAMTSTGKGIEHLMTSPSFAIPEELISSLPRTKSNIFDKFLSIGTREDHHLFLQLKDGTRNSYGIGSEVGMRSQVARANTEMSQEVVKNILKGAGVGTGNARAIADHFKGFATKYHQQLHIEKPFLLGKVEMLNKVLKGDFNSAADTKLRSMSQLMKASKGETKNLPPEYQEMHKVLSDEIASMKSRLGEFEDIVKAADLEYETLAKQAASKWSTARIAYATDGYGLKEGNAWLANMLSPAEKQAASELTAVNNFYAVKMKEQGHKTIAGSYLHHPAHPDVDFSKGLEALGKWSTDSSDAMRLINFYQRSSGSHLMMPDVEYVMAKYLPDVNKRLQINDMWKMGKPGGWDAVRKTLEARGGYDGALKLLDDVRTAFDPGDISKSADWINRYAAFEVARLLTLSPSVSFKHALKLMGNWTVFPADVSARASAENFGLQARMLAQDIAGSAWQGKDNVADLSRALTSMHHTYAAISDMAPFDVPTKWVDKALMNWNKVGSTFVNAVERWDRGQTFISAMMMSQKKGMTPEQALFGLMDSVLKVNFLTGPNNPKWLKDPFIRTMMLFQSTPFKIMEQRGMLAYKGGKDIANAGRELMKQLRADVKEGESRFKWNLIKDELTRGKDVYGINYSTQIVKQILVLGTVIGGGAAALDIDLGGHAVHFPGLQMGERGVQLGLNPIVGAAYQTAMGTTVADEDDFWLSKFFQQWLGGTGFPAIAHKIARLNDSDIPAIYKENKMAYLFGVPMRKDKE